MKTSVAIRAYAKEKSEKLKKYFAGRINVDWNFGMERELRHAHCHITGNHIDFFAEAQTDDLYASIEMVIDKIESRSASIRKSSKTTFTAKVAILRQVKGFPALRLSNPCTFTIGQSSFTI